MSLLSITYLTWWILSTTFATLAQVNIETRCPRPRDIENGWTIVSSTAVGGMATFGCQSGFEPVGNLVLVCQENREWNGSLPFCDSIRLNPFKNEFGGDLFLLFDASNNVGREIFEMTKRFSKELVRKIGVSSDPNSLRVGALYYDYSAHIAFHTTAFHSTSEVIKIGINNIPYTGGGNNPAEALRFVREVMIPHSDYREGSLQSVVIMNHSHGNTGGSPLNEVMYLEAIGVKIYCVYFGQEYPSYLFRMCSQPHKQHIFYQKNYLSIYYLVSKVLRQSTDSMYSECGVSSLTISRGRVVGGNNANPGAWPWQVFLDMRTRSGLTRHTCGGALIDREWVLTTAACVSSCPECNITTVLGIIDLTEPRDQEIEVEERIVHPGYDSNTYRNDIALLKLKTPAGLNDNVRIVCLPNKNKANRLIPPNPSNRHAAVVTGWGHSSPRLYPSIDPVQSEDRLQQLALPLRSREDCRASLEGKREELFFDETMFCAGYKIAVLGPCAGDAGGPLVKKAKRKRHHRWTLIGLTSWGRGCAVQNELDFFTNVPHFMDWITWTMHPQ